MRGEGAACSQTYDSKEPKKTLLRVKGKRILNQPVTQKRNFFCDRERGSLRKTVGPNVIAVVLLLRAVFHYDDETGRLFVHRGLWLSRCLFVSRGPVTDEPCPAGGTPTGNNHPRHLRDKIESNFFYIWKIPKQRHSLTPYWGKASVNLTVCWMEIKCLLSVVNLNSCRCGRVQPVERFFSTSIVVLYWSGSRAVFLLNFPYSFFERIRFLPDLTNPHCIQFFGSVI